MLFQGTLRVAPKRRKVAYISNPAFSRDIDICIPEESYRNRSYHGDCVEVEVFPEEEWISNQSVEDDNDIAAREDGAKNLILEIDVNQDIQQALWKPKEFQVSSSAAEDPVAGEEDHPLAVRAKLTNKQPTGRVVRIISSNHPCTFTGTLKTFCGVKQGERLPSSERNVLFRPNNPRYPHMIAARMLVPAAFVEDPFQGERQLYIADLCAEWPASSKMPPVQNIRSVGEAGCIEAETEALLVENGVHHGIFTDQMLEPLYELLKLHSTSNESAQELTESISNLAIDGQHASSTGAEEIVESHWCIPEDEILRRRDLRSTRIFTIDPPTAKDLDDALHITKQADGTYEIGYVYIHILAM